MTLLSSHVRPWGRRVPFGVEAPSPNGIGLARFLRRQRHHVHEVDRPPRKSRRLTGKSDLPDAEHPLRQDGLTGARPPLVAHRG
jgi:hypothetical protein